MPCPGHHLGPGDHDRRTSKVVDRVESTGYCRRRANPADRRSSLAELTPSGRRVLDQATAVFEGELHIRIGSVLPEQAREDLASSLARLRAAGQPESQRRSA